MAGPLLGRFYPWGIYHFCMIYLFVAHCALCRGQTESLQGEDAIDQSSVANFYQSAKMIVNPFTSADVNQQDHRDKNALMKPKANVVKTTKSRQRRRTTEPWKETYYVGQSFERPVKSSAFFILDNYVPRSVLIKVANFVSLYGRKGRTISLTNSERNALMNSAELLKMKLHKLMTSDPLVFSKYLSERLPELPSLLRPNFDYLVNRLVSRLVTKGRSHSIETPRQTPFGIVNLFIGFLADPIVLGLVLTFTLWLLFWGVYSLVVGSGFFLFPILGFAPGGGGGGGGGGGEESSGGGSGSVPSSAAVNIIQATHRPPTVITDLPESEDSLSVTDVTINIDGESSVDSTTTATPIVLNFPILQACLSLGGNKAACVAQASLYAQVLQKPVNNSGVFHDGSGTSTSTVKPYYKPIKTTTPKIEDLFEDNLYPNFPSPSLAPAPPPSSFLALKPSAVFSSSTTPFPQFGVITFYPDLFISPTKPSSIKPKPKPLTTSKPSHSSYYKPIQHHQHSSLPPSFSKYPYSPVKGHKREPSVDTVEENLWSLALPHQSIDAILKQLSKTNKNTEIDKLE